MTAKKRIARKTIRVWAFIRPDGSIVADSSFADADATWAIGLGWPSDEEIKKAKKHGYVVTQVTIIL